MPGRGLRHLARLLASIAVAALWFWPGAPAAAADADSCPPAARAPSPDDIARAAQSARDRGLLWRIERDGKVSWLYGTIHVGRIEWTFPGPKVGAALREAKALALELDVGSPEVLRQIAARRDAGRASAALAPALAAKLERQFAAACVDRALVAGHSPLMQVVTLSVLSARRDGLDPSYGQEPVLAGLVRALGMPVHSLETVAGQLAVLEGTSSAEQQALVSQALDQLDNGQARTTLVKLAQAWEDGDLEALGRYEEWCNCARDTIERAFLTRLNDERNPVLADGIAALHQRAAPVFAAVGALHMTGEKALTTLLRARGFAVERVR